MPQAYSDPDLYPEDLKKGHAVLDPDTCPFGDTRSVPHPVATLAAAIHDITSKKTHDYGKDTYGGWKYRVHVPVDALMSPLERAELATQHPYLGSWDANAVDALVAFIESLYATDDTSGEGVRYNWSGLSVSSGSVGVDGLRGAHMSVNYTLRSPANDTITKGSWLVDRIYRWLLRKTSPVDISDVVAACHPTGNGEWALMIVIVVLHDMLAATLHDRYPEIRDSIRADAAKLRARHDRVWEEYTRHVSPEQTQDLWGDDYRDLPHGAYIDDIHDWYGAQYVYSVLVRWEYRWQNYTRDLYTRCAELDAFSHTWDGSNYTAHDLLRADGVACAVARTVHTGTVSAYHPTGTGGLNPGSSLFPHSLPRETTIADDTLVASAGECYAYALWKMGVTADNPFLPAFSLLPRHDSTAAIPTADEDDYTYADREPGAHGTRELSDHVTRFDPPRRDRIRAAAPDEARIAEALRHAERVDNALRRGFATSPSPLGYDPVRAPMRAFIATTAAVCSTVLDRAATRLSPGDYVSSVVTAPSTSLPDTSAVSEHDLAVYLRRAGAVDVRADIAHASGCFVRVTALSALAAHK